MVKRSPTPKTSIPEEGQVMVRFCVGSATLCSGFPAIREVTCDTVLPVPTPVCAGIYAPVCGQKPDECTAFSCKSFEPKTYNSMCHLKKDKADYLYSGVCKNSPTPSVAPRNCKIWNDGCNVCKIEIEILETTNSMTTLFKKKRFFIKITDIYRIFQKSA